MNMRYLTFVAAVITAGVGIALISKNDMVFGVLAVGAAVQTFLAARTMAG